MTGDAAWRVGIVGLGRAVTGIAGSAERKIWSHPAAIVDHSGLDLVAVFDPDEAVARAFCQAWGCVAVPDWLGLAAQSLDCLLIAAPTPRHAAYLRDAHEAGIPVVVCEKPLCDDRDAAHATIRAYREAGSGLHVYYPRRWISQLDALRRAIAEGEFGGLRSFSAYYGNGLRNIGCHAIELILRLLGPVARVRAHPPAHDGDPSDPTPDLRLGLAGGGDGILQAYRYGDYALFELDMLFEKGRARVSDLGFRLETWRAAPSARYPGFRELAPAPAETTDYGEAARRFWRYVRSESGRTTVDDWELNILDVVEAGLESLRVGREIDVGAGNQRR